MKFCPYILLLLCCFGYYPLVSGQTNFRGGWEAANPVDKQSTLSFDEKIKAHQAFLTKAEQTGDPLQKIYGNLYLAYDHLHNQDYANATDCLLKAEAIANQSDNPGWQGWIIHRKAIVSLRLKKTEEALQLYQQAASLCGQGQDSLCVAESLEQVSLMYGKLDDFENAERYHNFAMPLIEKYGGQPQLGAALNNYGNVNSYAGRYGQAVDNYEKAIGIYQKLGKKLEMAKAMNNLADGYKYLHRYKDAERVLMEAMRINQENNFLENLQTNYANASVLYDSIGNYRLAFLNLHSFVDLRDSLTGAETQRKIAELQIKYDSQNKELELEKSKSALAEARRSVEHVTAASILVLLLGSIALWYWRMKAKQAKLELDSKRETLTDMTRLLMEKNKQLAALTERAQIPAEEPTAAANVDDFETNLYNQHILTDDDWASFKIYFEKAHPKYLHRLRTAFPALTDAEERLFLFIKLNLNTKEVATILGISAESVKKTRNRLRKKLELGEEVVLEDFIRNF